MSALWQSITVEMVIIVLFSVVAIGALWLLYLMEKWKHEERERREKEIEAERALRMQIRDSRERERAMRRRQLIDEHSAYLNKNL